MIVGACPPPWQQSCLSEIHFEITAQSLLLYELLQQIAAQYDCWNMPSFATESGNRKSIVLGVCAQSIAFEPLECAKLRYFSFQAQK
jgi:hypothetical protein